MVKPSGAIHGIGRRSAKSPKIGCGSALPNVAAIAKDAMALLIGFALDQQVSVEKAFSGPLAIKERVGTLEPAKLADTDLEPVLQRLLNETHPGAPAVAG